MPFPAAARRCWPLLLLVLSLPAALPFAPGAAPPPATRPMAASCARGTARGCMAVPRRRVTPAILASSADDFDPDMPDWAREIVESNGEGLDMIDLGGGGGGEGETSEVLEDIEEEDVRFGMKMKALRGEFDPSKAEMNTERGDALSEALVTLPGMVNMRVVVKAPPEDPAVAESVLESLRGAAGVSVGAHSLLPRLGGKFTTVDVTCHIDTHENRKAAFDLLGTLPGVVMRF